MPKGMNLIMSGASRFPILKPSLHRMFPFSSAKKREAVCSERITSFLNCMLYTASLSNFTFCPTGRNKKTFLNPIWPY